MKRSVLTRLVPPALAGYRRSWLRTDLVAGCTLAAVAIPESMGYSSIAHVPVVAGLYTIILPAAVFAVLGSSRLMVVGADSATAALLASGIAGLGVAGLVPGSQSWLRWACLIAIVTGGLLALARVFRLGFLGDFLSTAVLIGFLAGTGITVMTGQVPALLGLPGTDGSIATRWWAIVSNLDHINWATAGFAAAAILALVLGGRLAPRFPVAVVVVIGSIAAVAVFGWGDQIAVVGAVHGGLPDFGWPTAMGFGDVVKAATVAGGCALVILAQSAATARSFAQRHGQNADVDRDVVGLSAANLVAGFSGTFVVNGSPTKTQLLDDQRGRTQVANLTMAAITLLVVVFADGLLADLPHAVLAAIVFLVALRLIDVRGFVRIWRIRPIEFGIAVLTVVVVVAFGVQVGVVASMVVSLLELVRRQYRPERFVLGVGLHGHPRYEPATPGSQSLPGLIVFRYDADLFYANAGRFADDVMALVNRAPDPVRWLVLDASAMSDVDYSASTVLTDLIGYIHSRGAHFVLVGVDPELQRTLGTEHILGELSPDHIFASVSDALRAYRRIDPGGRQQTPTEQ
ncbi:SulP family inorganic anion transporter [Gordonia sp. DT30]|uniref:SulP family inorganic anion transporter n=1 Tax=unclassified Gordonia (in: high G+C Gram-positive bacteria) TaxID=2657482 RepID=UPI003CF509C2